MGYLYELAVTPYVMAKKHFGGGSCAGARGAEQRVPFGAHRQQRFSYWEPAQPAHDAVVLYFHGGGFVFGESQSMADAADVYVARGYRYCSIGFREAPFAKFPAQVDDAFEGAKAAVAWLEARGVDCGRLVVGGTSAGGMLAYLMCYSRKLQHRYGFEDLARRIARCVSIAGVSDACDLIVKPFPCYAAWRTCVRVPAEGHSREAMRRALDDYSPERVVGDAQGGCGREAHAKDGAAFESSGKGADPAAERGARTADPAAELDAKMTAPAPVPHVPAFIMHGRADTLAPFPSQVRFVHALERAIGKQNVTFRVLESWKWQHMFLTVSLHKRDPQTFAPLKELFAWLDGLDGPGKR